MSSSPSVGRESSEAEDDLTARIARSMGRDPNSAEFRAIREEWEAAFAPFEEAVRQSQIISADDLATRVAAARASHPEPSTPEQK